jgi:hypothetical protein
VASGGIWLLKMGSKGTLFLSSFRRADQREPRNLVQLPLDSGLEAEPVIGPDRWPRPGMTGLARLRPCPFVAHAQEFHRPVGDRDPESRADGAFDQMDVAAMGADQFSGDRETQPAAAGPP